MRCGALRACGAVRRGGGGVRLRRGRGATGAGAGCDWGAGRLRVGAARVARGPQPAAGSPDGGPGGRTPRRPERRAWTAACSRARAPGLRARSARTGGAGPGRSRAGARARWWVSRGLRLPGRWVAGTGVRWRESERPGHRVFRCVRGLGARLRVAPPSLHQGLYVPPVGFRRRSGGGCGPRRVWLGTQGVRCGVRRSQGRAGGLLLCAATRRCRSARRVGAYAPLCPATRAGKLPAARLRRGRVPGGGPVYDEAARVTTGCRVRPRPSCPPRPRSGRRPSPGRGAGR